jgi:hypothetical protein
MRKLSVVTLSFAAVAALAPQMARPCSFARCGDPTSSLTGAPAFVADSGRVGLDVDRYSSSQATSTADVQEDEVDMRFTATGSYTFGRYLTLIGRVPFVRRTVTTGNERTWLLGLSNPEVLAQYQFYSDEPRSWAAVTLGFRPGLGQNDRTIDTELAGEHVQPGTGASGFDAGLSFSHLLGSGDTTSAFGSLTGRTNGRNARGYHYGGAVIVDLGLDKALSEQVNGVLELKFRHAGGDEVTEGTLDPNTGGSVVYLSPHVLFKLGPKFLLRLGLQVPVVKSLTGVQSEKVDLLSGLTVRF